MTHTTIERTVFGCYHCGDAVSAADDICACCEAEEDAALEEES